MITSNQDIINKAFLLEDIFASLRVNKITFSKTKAMKIVGGRGILERLVANQKIRVIGIKKSQFGKWECLAEDVLKYARYKDGDLLETT